MSRLAALLLSVCLAGASCPERPGTTPRPEDLRCAPTGRACSNGAECCSGVCNNQHNASLGNCR